MTLFLPCPEWSTSAENYTYLGFGGLYDSSVFCWGIRPVIACRMHDSPWSQASCFVHPVHANTRCSLQHWQTSVQIHFKSKSPVKDLEILKDESHDRYKQHCEKSLQYFCVTVNAGSTTLLRTFTVIRLHYLQFICKYKTLLMQAQMSP